MVIKVPELSDVWKRYFRISDIIQYSDQLWQGFEFPLGRTLGDVIRAFTIVVFPGCWDFPFVLVQLHVVVEVVAVLFQNKT